MPATVSNAQEKLNENHSQPMNWAGCKGIIPMAERSYRTLFWAFVLVGAVTDQVSKYVVFKELYNEGDGGALQILPGVFRLETEYIKPKKSSEHALAIGALSSAGLPTRSTPPSMALDQDPSEGMLAPLRTWSGVYPPHVNQGALFGIRLGLGERDGWLANALFAIVSLAAAVAIIYWTTRPTTARDPYLSAALGLILAGTLGNLYDRLVFSGVRDFLDFYWIRWPVFNFADCYLVCGAFLLLAQALVHRPAVSAAQKPKLALADIPAEAK